MTMTRLDEINERMMAHQYDSSPAGRIAADVEWLLAQLAREQAIADLGRRLIHTNHDDNGPAFLGTWEQLLMAVRAEDSAVAAVKAEQETGR